MTIQTTKVETEALMKLSGWLITQTAPELEKAVEELGDGVRRLVLDCTELEYISSAGLRQIVVAHKRMNGELILRGVSGEIMDILRMSGFDKRLHIEA